MLYTKDKIIFIINIFYLLINYIALVENIKFIIIFAKYYTIWSGARVAEEARLESVYASKAHRGFESPSLRQITHL